ncbi:MAG: hypothetical protein WBW16_14040 [Bacteroidota bacterium]
MNEKQVTSAFIAWMRADLMLSLFEHYRDQRTKEHGNVVPDITMVKDHDGICLFLWQACLFAVLDFLDKRHFLPEPIAAEFATIRDHLNKFRDCVFHVRDEFLHPNQDALFDTKDAIAITRHLHVEVGKFLRAELDASEPR